MTKEEKINQIWQLEILHENMKSILTSIEECHQSYFRKGDNSNMFISGETGLGKTTICYHYAAKYPRQNDESGTLVPVLYTRTPSSPTLKSLTTKMLDDLCDPAAEKGSFVKQKIRLKELIQACGTQLVILDELQHLIDADRERILKSVSNLVKELIEELQVPIVMVGLPESLGVLTSNRQLGRRVSQRPMLSEFRWDDETQRRQFRSFLKTIDEKLPLEKSSQLATFDLAKKIHFASDGVMDHFMKLIRHAAQIAVELDLDHIDLPLLSHVYDKHIAALFPERFNPFAEQNSDRQLRLVRNNTNPTGQKAVSNHIKPRAIKETPGSVLKR